MDDKEFTMAVAAPFRLDFTAWALRRRASNIVDQWVDGHYARLFVIRDRTVWVTVVQPRDAGQELVVRLRSAPRADERLQNDVQLLVRKMFGLTTDLARIHRQVIA